MIKRHTHHWTRGSVCIILASFLAPGTARNAFGQAGTVLSHQKISSTVGGFTGGLDNEDELGVVASLGDLDGDGVDNLAVGARGDDKVIAGNRRIFSQKYRSSSAVTTKLSAMT